MTRTSAVPSSEFRQIRAGRTFEEIAAQVREMLFGGSLKTGDRLPPERELASTLGVGRPALREALRTLEVSGLIELRTGKSGGAFIANRQQRVVSSSFSDMVRLRNVSVSELFEAREWFLLSLVTPACQRISADEIQGLRNNIALAERLHAESRLAERIDCNFDFHRLLAESTRNQFALIVVQGITDAVRSLIDRVGTELAPGFFKLRRQLVAALEEKNEALALQRMQELVKGTERTYKRLAQVRLGEPIDRPNERFPIWLDSG